MFKPFASPDDCGFLSYYKENNPQGTIIAFDLETPSYLSETDYLVQGDVQILLPDFAKYF